MSAANGGVIAESWKRQTLLNVVRLRHADAPVFLDVSSVINSYTLGGNANAQATIPSRTNPDVLQFGGTANWSNTPTVTYQPLLDDRFTKSLLQPVPPVSVFQLMQGGWSAPMVLRTVVASVNGLRNASGGAPADPGFEELREALGRVQREGNMGLRVEARKDGGGAIVVLRRPGSGTALSDDSRRVRQLLGLPEDASEFEVAFGLIPRQPNEVAMLSRSMTEIMLQLGFGIELPEEPADAYTSVPYKGRWYWIDDTDVPSKGVFTFLMILFSLAETGQTVAAPVVTVPSR